MYIIDSERNLSALFTQTKLARYTYVSQLSYPLGGNYLENLTVWFYFKTGCFMNRWAVMSLDKQLPNTETRWINTETIKFWFQHAQSILHPQFPLFIWPQWMNSLNDDWKLLSFMKIYHCVSYQQHCFNHPFKLMDIHAHIREQVVISKNLVCKQC